MNKNKLTNGFIIGTFVSLYIVVSLISTIHVIDFFRLSNPDWLAISLAIAFEIGAAASLAALIALKKMSKWMVWGVFIILACMQMMGNTFYAYTHLHDFQGWTELFGINEEELIYQKRVLSIISGAILPLIALGFIKSLVDYIRPEELKTKIQEPEKTEAIVENLERNNSTNEMASPIIEFEPVIETVVETPKPVEEKKPRKKREPAIETIVETPKPVKEKKPRKKREPAPKPAPLPEPLNNRPGRRPGGNPQVIPGVN